MAKRKRGNNITTSSTSTSADRGKPKNFKVPKTNGHVDVKTISPAIQIITGSYERVLHGVTASISGLSEAEPSVKFADSFLFNAHASAIRCLALSPLPDPETAETQGVFLATGGSDEKINVYSLSATPVIEDASLPPMPSLGSKAISEHPRNRELGTLLHHSSNITALHFPTRSKMLSASEDNTIAVTRLKDLTVVSTIKAPHPKVQGQPSGDTAPPGATPAGVNDFAVHPSLKLMLSVGRGERCMRLWNLVTGKKAGVLNFSRDILSSVKEGKYSSGEGRRIKWNPDGTEFSVAFERGAIVFGADSKPRCQVLPRPLTKLHQISYLTIPSFLEKDATSTILAVSTEDGRILFYDTDIMGKNPNSEGATIPEAALQAQLGGKATGITTRIKDFELLVLPLSHGKDIIIIITASSDGAIRLFSLAAQDLLKKINVGQAPVQVGKQVGLYETGNRITCLKSFVMLPGQLDVEAQNGDDFGGFDEESTSDRDSTSGSGSE